MTEAEWNEHVRLRAIKLSSLFAAVASEVPGNSIAAIMANKGGLLAMELCGEAAKRNIDTGLQTEAQEVAAGGYDLAALATAPPSRIED